MGVYETLAQTGANKLSISESYSINLTHTCSALVKEGARVKLNNDGTVSPIAARTEMPYGVVVAANKIAGGKVTVQTDFSAVTLGKASGTLAIGDLVCAAGYDGTLHLTTYQAGVAASGHYASAIVLVGAANNGTCKVGVLRAPRLVP